MTQSKPEPNQMTLGHLLANVSRLVGSRMRMMLEEIGLQHAQAMVLFHLWQENGIAQNVLAQALHITPPTATSTLQRMERDGWVQRRRDTVDQRIVRVYLTKKAMSLRKEARDTFQELDKELTAVLSANERRTLLASLSKVRCYLLQSAETPDRSGSGPAGAVDAQKAVQ